MLPLLYESDDIAGAIVDDYEAAPIPDIHKVMYRWVEKFTRCSWELTAADIEALRGAGANDGNIVDWAQVAALQTWWVMNADGGGIPLERDAVTGVAVGHRREWYESSAPGLTAAAPAAPPAPRAGPANHDCWVATETDSATYRDAAAAAEQRWGFVPNLFPAVSLRPDILPRHQLALELLETPQAASLSPRQQALVRALTTSLNRAPYGRRTACEQLLRSGADEATFDRVSGDYTAHDWAPADRAVLDFATKMARNAHKVTEDDAQALRDAGLDDEAYVDVLETVTIQSSLDRLTNALGVAPDEAPILAR